MLTWRTFCVLFVTLGASACATKRLSFKGDAGLKVALVSPKRLNEDGSPLGETPLVVNVDDTVGRVIRISKAGKDPVYWFVTDAASETTEATISLRESASQAGGKTSINRVLRLVMRAYQALSGKRYKDARELADQAGKIDSEIAAPQVIKGLAYYYEGNLPEAKAALAKAQALDPEDKDINALLDMVRK